MASYHLSAEIVGRSSGRSATAAAAYRAIEREATRHEGPAVRAMERKEQERCVREGREYAPVTDRARENELIMERNALVERPSGII